MSEDGITIRWRHRSVFGMTCAHCGETIRGDDWARVERGRKEKVFLHGACLEAREDQALDLITGAPATD